MLRIQTCKASHYYRDGVWLSNSCSCINLRMLIRITSHLHEAASEAPLWPAKRFNI